tara:strand:+ start:115 stop:441 length:327 start_codon:yes stop_codon:yes gene_type:complete
MDYTELYNILDDNNITYEGDDNNRDTAIKIILELKKRKAKKDRGIIIEDEDVINRYLLLGMDGIKKMFNREYYYLYSTNFVYDVLFYHYKNEWRIIEGLIINKIKNDR